MPVTVGVDELFADEAGDGRAERRREHPGGIGGQP
jgi:hypothetical protein